MKKILIMTLCFLCSSSSMLLAENTLNISLDDTIQMAIEASEDLKLQDNNVKRSRSAKKAATGAALPQVMGSFSLSNNFEYPDIEATAATRDYHANAGVRVDQTLFTFGKVSNAIAAAKQAFEASRFDQQATKQVVIYNAKIAFYNAYLAQQTLAIAEESYNNALNNKEILIDRAAGGRSSKYDNIKISADVASRKPSVNNARADFLSAMETVKVMIGADLDDGINLVINNDKKYKNFNRDEMVAALYEKQPELKSLSKKIERSEKLVKSKRAALMPEVDAFATWNRKGDGHDYYIGSEQLDDYGVVGLQVSVPIWAGGVNRENLYQARIDQRDAELLYDQGEEQFVLSLDKALNSYKEYKKTLEANNEAVELAEESFKYSQQLFVSGQVSVTDLNDAELQLTTAKTNREITIFNLNSTLATIERLTVMENSND